MKFVNKKIDCIKTTMCPPAHVYDARKARNDKKRHDRSSPGSLDTMIVDVRTLLCELCVVMARLEDGK